MKRLYIYLLISFFVGGFFTAPFFVLASDSICYVNNLESGESYKQISQAISAGCGEIRVSSGTYKEDLSLGKGLKLKGENREEVVIEGKAIIDDNAEVSGVTFSTGGVEISDGANVEINNSIIKDSIVTGIVTIGGGKLDLYDVNIFGNKKGAYIKAGKEIKIINCKVYNNTQEGLDIRANTKGIIAHNKINENKESGIEIILGGTEMDIFENELNNNESSGIAVQYYMESTDLGNVKIRDNFMLGNDNYGLDCRTPSGGDGRPKGYYMNSLLMGNNEVRGNGKKEISSFCKFDDNEIFDITQIKEDRAEEILDLEKKEKDSSLLDVDRKELEELRILDKRESEIIQINTDKKEEIKIVFNDVEKLFEEDNLIREEIEKRSTWLVFLMGEDYQAIENIKNNILIYDEKIKIIKEEKYKITDKEMLSEVNSEINFINQEKEELIKFIQGREDKFNLFGWLFKNKSS